MSWAKAYRELNKAIHDWASFDCGEAELNEFIRTKAAKHMAAGISRTMLLPAFVPLPDGKYLCCHNNRVRMFMPMKIVGQLFQQ